MVHSLEFPLLEQRKLPNLQNEITSAFTKFTDIDKNGIYVFTQNQQEMVKTGMRRQSVMADKVTVISYRNYWFFSCQIYQMWSCFFSFEKHISYKFNFKLSILNLKHIFGRYLKREKSCTFKRILV